MKKHIIILFTLVFLTNLGFAFKCKTLTGESNLCENLPKKVCALTSGSQIHAETAYSTQGYNFAKDHWNITILCPLQENAEFMSTQEYCARHQECERDTDCKLICFQYCSQCFSTDNCKKLVKNFPDMFTYNSINCIMPGFGTFI
ncbi:hypothetical protein CYY_005093 [Polysphondylium violaceum]|uniref:FZ domain-containing protein n=1 Tax=Polysphondylium violaceum TaxID=133409 RepID=A0A8J4V759_9MYCE|nr:hypothetical protein CYY_005093 [Polysphondylium violaceum]